MTPPGKDEGIRITVASDGMTAKVILQPDLDETIDAATQIRAALQQRDVAVTAQVLAAIEEAVEQWDRESGESHEFVAARGLEPQHGTRGCIRFAPKFTDLGRLPTFRGRTAEDERGESSPPEPSPPPSQRQGGENEHAVDHRQKSNLLIVKAEETIAEILPPVEGSDGVDVRGKVLACKQPQPFELSHDDSIDVREDGSVVARHDGALIEDGGKLKVERELHIREYVDFTTGNVAFNGDVHVSKGVRDGFVVDIDGALRVDGLIEAATIRTSGDARFARGMAARDKGLIEIGGSLSAHYLDSVRGSVGLDLVVDKEIVHCCVDVGRRLHATHAALIGGCLTVAGPVELKVLGSVSQAGTLRVGRLGQLDELLERSHRLREKVKKKLEEARERHDVFKKAVGKVQGAQADELTNLVFQVQTLQADLEKLDKTIERGNATVARLAQVDVKIESLIHAKTVLQVRQRSFLFRQSVKGPVRIVENEHGEPTLIDERNGASADLKHYAEEREEREETPVRRAS